MAWLVQGKGRKEGNKLDHSWAAGLLLCRIRGREKRGEASMLKLGPYKQARDTKMDWGRGMSKWVGPSMTGPLALFSFLPFFSFCWWAGGDNWAGCA